MTRVRTLNNRYKTSGETRVFINYIVYEQNDDGLLLECEIESSGNRFYSTICLRFPELNQLMGVLSSQHNIDLYELISEHCISNNHSVCEINLLKKLGHPLVIRGCLPDFIQTRRHAKAG